MNGNQASEGSSMGTGEQVTCGLVPNPGNVSGELTTRWHRQPQRVAACAHR